MYFVFKEKILNVNNVCEQAQYLLTNIP
ncbi:hypothetical protein CNEO4_1510054 [Clostridium neonatale]|uniref:Uncharacterized protein n=1 Tax=Clostridium neonatale TaxID=137838 RepID=A0AA86MQ26_9CLOT|nr:hypothetical protein CNEO_44189 [Clostridium neonatale]CAI3246233.1 hypothetical protein CNEO2_520016 [Clostridium neonatale]CAI3583143.1 hypothetical protein CNEO4_200047 [Clostridium neonatale]CAI3604249.1 hypothetical protein CNEO4_290040 [Clostridium neonatale]CAI3608992.1 hypothetical protein CNEO4_1510054 [Clostridium neonatale]